MTRRCRFQKFTVDLPAQGDWSTPQRVTVGRSGRLVRSAFRAPATSTVTEVDIMVWQGNYATVNGPSYTCTTTDPADVPQEDVLLHITGVAVTGSATALDDDTVLSDVANAGVLDVRDYAQSCWVAVKSVAASAPQLGAVLRLEFVDVE